MNALALPLSFVGVENWQVIQWVAKYQIGFEFGGLIVIGLIFLGILIWLTIDLRGKRK